MCTKSDDKVGVEMTLNVAGSEVGVVDVDTEMLEDRLRRDKYFGR
jgi:hypothetical protein